MRQDSSQVGKEALVDSKRALGLDCAEQAVKGTRVQVAGLIVHAAHDGVRRVHDAANNKARAGRGHEMQRGTLLHAQVFYKIAFGKEIRGELHARAKAGADHGRHDAAVEAFDALGAVDLGEAIGGIPVLMLGANRQQGTIALETSLDEE